MNRLDTFPSKDLIQKYRNTFSSPEGREVLAHIMFELGMFLEVPLTPEDITLKNYASRLLTILGAGEVGVNAVGNLLNGLFAQPLEKKSSR